MRITTLAILSTLLLFLASCAARPAPGEIDNSGVYVRADYGLGILNDTGISETISGTTTSSEAEFDAGQMAGLGVGYRVDDNWAFELEAMYRSNDVDTATASGGGVVANAGDFASLSLMANARYFFDTGSRWRPYLGAGIGLVEEIDIDLEGPGVGPERSYSDSAFGFQGFAGLAYELNDNWSFQAEGRYFRAVGFDFEGEDSSGGNTADADGYDHFGVTLGVTYTF